MHRSLGKNFSVLLISTSIAVLGVVNKLVTALPMTEMVTLVLTCGLGIRRLIEGDGHWPTALADPGPPADFQNALDFVQDAIAVLDAGAQLTYANLEFRRLWKLADANLSSRPLFSKTFAAGCAAGIYKLENAGEDFDWGRRLEASTLLEATPVTLRMADLSTVRISISPLPDGGWMLICSNITDLAHDAERLEELAHVDSMTGLVNRRRFFDVANREWLMSTRYAREIAVLMIDIDHFKKVNDNFGHDAGDAAIRHIAAICQESKRATDIVARLGGEEFAILMPETGLAGAVVLAERIRSRIAVNRLKADGGWLSLTVSIGAAERQLETADFDALLKISDQRLYDAKRAGRNVVVHAETPEGFVPASVAA